MAIDKNNLVDMVSQVKDTTNHAEMLTVQQASDWASKHLGRKVTPSNISYLLQYGRVHKHQSNGMVMVCRKDLANYYHSYLGKREVDWKRILGDDLNWHLSFDYLKEKDTTKHVHRLHPYKGKFIPQLVEYFIDEHIDEFKKEAYFLPSDTILDPFCGSGTTLVQSNELGINALGIDVSVFNCLISNIKVKKCDLSILRAEIKHITAQLKKFIETKNNRQFEQELLNALNLYNRQFFPSPEYRMRIRNKEINELSYGKEKERGFLPIYKKLLTKYDIHLTQSSTARFLDKWFLWPVRDEIDFTLKHIKTIKDKDIQDILTIMLSRTVRSCRATTHADLATLKDPITTTYYCSKHGKICKPLFSIFSWWLRYTQDTLNRLMEFNKLRTNTTQVCLCADARDPNLLEKLQETHPDFYQKLHTKKINGIFSSPPYIGLIDYHEQHAYAYDLFDFNRLDNLEIGSMKRGAGSLARKEYITGIADVLRNCRKFLIDDFNIFLVANDKHNVYPAIAEMAGMQIVNRYKRPVLNRTEKNRSAYAETIFHFKDK